MKKTGRTKPEEEPEYLVLDQNARVFIGLLGGEFVFSDNIDEGKPLQGQEKFNFMRRHHYASPLEQMFLEDGRKERKHRKNRVSV